MNTLNNYQPGEVILLDNSNKLDFENFNTQVLDLETLKRTHKENDVTGQPLKGVYHYQFIENIAEICERSGLNFQIEEIFAAQNKNRQLPGVVVLPQIEDRYGDKAIEAHILRRVFTTIRINDLEDEETNTTLALAFHQEGLQVAIGPNVKICHNQCILGRDKIISNYGKDKVTTEEVFTTVQNWLNDFFNFRERDIRIIKKMKQIPVTIDDIYKIIGLLTSIRVSHDSKNKSISSGVKCYPLSQSQISQFTDAIVEYNFNHGINGLTLWDIYNFATELYKPEKMEIPNLLPQNLSIIETFSGYFGLDQ